MRIDGYEINLVDEGTMDTVVDVCHERWNGYQTFRYDGMIASEYRDENGVLDLDAFARDIVIPDAEEEE